MHNVKTKLSIKHYLRTMRNQQAFHTCSQQIRKYNLMMIHPMLSLNWTLKLSIPRLREWGGTHEIVMLDTFHNDRQINQKLTSRNLCGLFLRL